MGEIRAYAPRPSRRAPDRFCKTCGGLITGRNRARAVYCSRACVYASPDVQEKLRAPRNSVTKTCPHCAQDFTVPASNANRYTYCSRACSVDARGVTTACQRCGALFRHSCKATRRYCSEACRRPPVMVTCEECGTTFRATPQAANARRFCSPHCYRASNAETSIERTVREALETRGIPHATQVGIGRWTVDFLVMGRLVLEADGDYWHSLRPDVDARKTDELTRMGYAVRRLSESVINGEGLSAALDDAITGANEASINPDAAPLSVH